MGSLDGKVAIVTGATSGIGERIAELFVCQGAHVVAAGRREAEGRALEHAIFRPIPRCATQQASLLVKCGLAMSFIRTDVTDENNVRAMVDRAVSRFGRLDCLVNNAGSGSPMVSITEVADEHFSLGFRYKCAGRDVRNEACRPRHDSPRFGQHHHHSKRCGSARRSLRAHIQCVQSGGRSFVTQRRVGNQQPGRSCQHDLSGWHCHEYLRQDRWTGRRQG